MELEPVIGLEIHVQLKTDSKMFCSCANDGDTREPNTTICPVCMGHPGTLPVPNRKAVQYAIRGALALGCTINHETKFDRKHYFYPDLPKGYQISQFDKPIGEHGLVELESSEGSKSIRIERLHLEEDAAKNNHHKPGVTHVDYNRAGTPLAEIVTHPDFRNAADAKQFLQELRLIMRTIGVSHADMEKGHLRCDANVSLRPAGTKELHPKTEVKNLNSFKSVERAIEYEIQRQTKLWKTNTPPAETTTRGWHDAEQHTYEQRSKETANDYRYFPEPDIPPLMIEDLAEDEMRHLPEMPNDKRDRFIREYKFKRADVRLMMENPQLGEFAEAVMSEAINWVADMPGDGTRDEKIEKHGPKLGKLVGGWITTKLLGELGERNITLSQTDVTPENFAELVAMVMSNQINSSTGTKVLAVMIDTGNDPSNIVDEQGWAQVSDEGALEDAIEKALKEHPDAVEKYKSGKTQLLMFLVGAVMKETKGSADPSIVKKLLEQKIT